MGKSTTHPLGGLSCNTMRVIKQLKDEGTSIALELKKSSFKKVEDTFYGSFWSEIRAIHENFCMLKKGGAADILAIKLQLTGLPFYDRCGWLHGPNYSKVHRTK